jgi:hypothetical protein
MAWSLAPEAVGAVFLKRVLRRYIVYAVAVDDLDRSVLGRCR